MDAFFACIRTGNRLFENDGTGRFVEITEEARIGYAGHSSQALAFDYDRDGLLDLYVANVGVFTSDELVASSHRPGEGDLRYYVGLVDAFAGHVIPERVEHSVLYRNLGGLRFEDVSERVGLDGDESWTGAALPIDGNRDGWPDLYVLNMQGRDEYWENRGGERFERRTTDVFPRTPWGSMGASTLDFDGDGDLDIFITDMHSDMFRIHAADRALEAEKIDAGDEPESFLRTGGTSIFGNALFRNDGPDRFVEVSAEWGAEMYWPWGPSVADLNADGHPDLVIPAGMGFVYRYHPNSVLLNDGGRRFRDAEYILGVEPRRDGRTTKPWTHMDTGDSPRELPIVSGLGLKGHVALWDAPVTRAAAVFDIDDDGDLDIFAREWAWRPQVLISNLSDRKPDLSYLKIRLTGTKSNRDGFGARVTVRAGSARILQLWDGRTGYLSQGVVPLYFGLGSAQRADAVEVVWPSGTRQVVTDGIPRNGLLEIRESE